MSAFDVIKRSATATLNGSDYSCLLPIDDKKYYDGLSFFINPNEDSVASSRIQVNHLGFKFIYKNDQVKIGVADMLANHWYELVFNAVLGGFIVVNLAPASPASPLTFTPPLTLTGTNVTHNTSGVTAGTYSQVTVDAYGHVTAGADHSIPVANTLFVSKSGVDLTALKGRFDKPFLTITAAQAAASAGDTVFIYPGTYLEGVFGKDGINYHCVDGVIIDSGIAVPWVSYGAITYSVSGDGDFRSTTNCVVSISGTGTITMSAKRLSNTSGQLFNVQDTAKVYATIKQEVISTTGICITLSTSGELNLTTNLISCGGLYLATSGASTTTLNLRANTIISSGTSVFRMGGTANVYGNIFYTGVGSAFKYDFAVTHNHNFYGDILSSSAALIIDAVTSISTGLINFYGRITSTGPIIIATSTATFVFYNEITTNTSTTPSITLADATVKVLSRITNLDANASSYGITKTNGTLILQNAIIKTTGGTESIHSAAPQDIKILGTLCSNVAKGVNITDLTGGVEQVDVDIV